MDKDKLYTLSFIVNYPDNKERHGTLLQMANMGALEDAIADIMSDNLATSFVLTIAVSQ